MRNIQFWLNLFRLFTFYLRFAILDADWLRCMCTCTTWYVIANEWLSSPKWHEIIKFETKTSILLHQITQQLRQIAQFPIYAQFCITCTLVCHLNLNLQWSRNWDLGTNFWVFVSVVFVYIVMEGDRYILMAYRLQIFLVLSEPLLCQSPSILFGCLRRPAGIFWMKENSCSWCHIHALWTLKSGWLRIENFTLCWQSTSKISSLDHHYLFQSQSQDPCEHQTKTLQESYQILALYNSNNPVVFHHIMSEIFEMLYQLFLLFSLCSCFYQPHVLL